MTPVKFNPKETIVVAPSLNGGGAEKIAMMLANHFVEVMPTILVLFEAVGPFISMVSDRVRIVKLGGGRYPKHFFKLRRLWRDHPNAQVISVIRDVNVWVGLSAYGLVLQGMVGREANTYHAVRNLKTFDRLKIIWLLRFAYKRFDSIVANSSDTKEDLCRMLNIHSNRVAIIRNPVLERLPLADCVEFEKPFELYPELRGRKIILNVGRLHIQKNQKRLIKIYADLIHEMNENERNEVALVILGDGPLKLELVQILSELNLKNSVWIIPFTRHVSAWYRISDVFALTSTWEGFGNVIVEALAHGMRIISYNCPGGPKEIIEHSRLGTLVEFGNEQAFKSHLRNALTLPRLPINYFAKDVYKYVVSEVVDDYLASLRNMK